MVRSQAFPLAELILQPRRRKVNRGGETFIDYLQTGRNQPVLFTKCLRFFQNVPGPQPPRAQPSGLTLPTMLPLTQVRAPPSSA